MTKEHILQLCLLLMWTKLANTQIKNTDKDIVTHHNTRDVSEMPESLAPNCGIDNKMSRQARVAGGTEVQIGEQPWTVYISVRKMNTDAERQLCVGTLITDTHVLTAKRCLCSKLYTGVKCRTARSLRIRLGSRNRFKGGFVAQVQDYKFNKGFNMSNPYTGGDLAVLKLQISNEQMAEMRNNKIHPVCLPTTEIKVTPGIWLTTVGWGKVSQSQYAGSAEILQKVELKVFDKEECSKYWMNPINEKAICTEANEDKDICENDNAAPLFIKVNKKWFQVGTVLLSDYLCGNFNARPTVFSNLFYFREWIVKSIKRLP